MARFRFRWEALLGVREAEEMRARRGLEAVRERYRRKASEIESLAREREDAKRRCGDEGPVRDGAAVRRALLARRQLASLHRRLVEKGEELQRIGIDLAQSREEFARARARKKVIERLRERRREAFLRERERGERREADEIGQVYTASRSPERPEAPRPDSGVP